MLRFDLNVELSDLVDMSLVREFFIEPCFRELYRILVRDLLEQSSISWQVVEVLTVVSWDYFSFLDFLYISLY